MIPIKVILADDEPLVRERYAERIPWEEAGFQFVGAACHGVQALELIEQHAPHLALIDITMPVMDGMELAGIIRSRWPKMKIVFLTAHDEFDYVKQALLIGANDYLLKVALSSEQVLATCERVAHTIRSDLEQSARNELERTQLAEYNWTKRKETLEQLLHASSNETNSEHRSRLMMSLPQTMKRGCVVWIGWELFDEAADDTQAPSERQRALCTYMKRITEDGAESGVDIFPCGVNKMALILTAQTAGVSLEQLLQKQLGHWLDQVERESGLSCFAYMGHICGSVHELVLELLQGTDELTAHFYGTDRIFRTDVQSACARILPEAAAELLRKVRLSASGGGEGYVREVIDHLTKLQDPPYHPEDLLRLAEQIVSETALFYSAEGISNRSLIERWPEYVAWWSQVWTSSQPFWSTGNAKVTRLEIRDACRYIQEHYSEDLLLSDIARRLGMNANYFGQLFKQETGRYFSDYVNHMRIQRAANLLARSPMKIYEVAHAVGITDYRHFCKTFKKITGFTPTAYKDQF